MSAARRRSVDRDIAWATIGPTHSPPLHRCQVSVLVIHVTVIVRWLYIQNRGKQSTHSSAPTFRNDRRARFPSLSFPFSSSHICSDVTKALDAETEATTEAAGFETEAEAVAPETETEDEAVASEVCEIPRNSL